MCLAYVVVALTTLVAGYTTLRTNLHEQLANAATTEASVLAAGAAGPLTKGNRGILQTFVGSLERLSGVDYAMVVGPNGTIAGSTRASDLNKSVPFTLYTSAKAVQLPNGDMEGFAPITVSTLAGFAEVRISGASVQSELRKNLVTELLVRGLGLVIFLLLSLVISQYILGPLSRLARAATAIRAGYLGARISVLDGTELGTVAEAFNDMAESLEHRIKHLSFLAAAGAVLPNTMREKGDVRPILEEFCQNLDAGGACLMRCDEDEQPSVCYQTDSIGVARWQAVVTTTRQAGEPTEMREDGYTAMGIPVLGDAVFVTLRAGDRPFSQEEQQVITNFAYEIGIAADNARLLESQQEALQVKDQFLSIVSHELRTPLTTIKGYAQMLRRKVADDPQSERFADHIDSQVSRLSRLVDDLLDVTRFSRGQFELMPEEMDLQPVLEEVVARFRVVTPRHVLNLDLDGGSFAGYWDPDRLEQVLNNLVSNAIKYSPDGGEITVATRHEDGRLLITVRDQGVGISEQDQEQLFQRFYRGSAEGQDIKGLGLGLYVTRRIVEAHGGEIGVRSAPGQGSEFFFTLPLVRQPAVQPAAH